MSYLSNAASAARTIAKKGMAGVVLRKTEAGFDPISGATVAPPPAVPENVSVLRLPPGLGEARYSVGSAPETQDRRERVKFLISGVFSVPAPGDMIQLSSDASRWEVEGCNVLSPGGVNILYTVGAVRV